MSAKRKRNIKRRKNSRAFKLTLGLLSLKKKKHRDAKALAEKIAKKAADDAKK